MMDSLSALVITFAVMSVISVVGILMLYLVKNEKLKNGIFYFLAIWGMVVAYCNVLATPTWWSGSVIWAWLLGSLSVIAILVKHFLKKKNSFQIARVLVTVSIVAGMIDCFMI